MTDESLYLFIEQVNSLLGPFDTISGDGGDCIQCCCFNQPIVRHELVSLSQAPVICSVVVVVLLGLAPE